jgi:hypothetical protein
MGKFGGVKYGRSEKRGKKNFAIDGESPRACINQPHTYTIRVPRAIRDSRVHIVFLFNKNIAIYLTSYIRDSIFIGIYSLFALWPTLELVTEVFTAGQGIDGADTGNVAFGD